MLLYLPVSDEGHMLEDLLDGSLLKGQLLQDYTCILPCFQLALE